MAAGFTPSTAGTGKAARPIAGPRNITATGSAARTTSGLGIRGLTGCRRLSKYAPRTGYIGWRSSEVDDDGNFVDPPIDRYSKMDEWTFVTLAQFANPITPEIIAPPDVAKTQLEESTDCRHTYLTYREIDRPGPHPADVADLCKDGGMLAPKTMRDELAAKTQPPPSSAMLATNTAAAITNGTNAPALLGTETDPTADTRKVKYWITMSLPTFSTPPPPDAKREEIYLYRPDFYQDQDGIERRITLWFNPNARTTLTEALGENAPHGPGTTTNAVNTPTIPASPATPASQETASAHNPFHSPLDDSFQPGSATTNRPANSSTKNPAPAPSGLITPDAPATNAAPANGN